VDDDIMLCILKFQKICISILKSEHHQMQNTEILNQQRNAKIQSVHCAGLLDVQGASENILSSDTMGSPGELKVIHSVTT
jgi:hypothetical protein